jgi:DNA repair exonuclease SbcCD ATPase subunit
LEKINEYEQNREVIENLEALSQQRLDIQKAIDTAQKQLDLCNRETLELYKSHGSLEQKLANLKEKKQELESLRQEHATYDLYQRCMHSSGISYDIIKKKLPVINNEIAKVLTSVVDFEVFFEEEGKRLNILIKHPGFDARPLEMGSGAEKTIAAMAIRLSLLSVSNLPKPSLFILDEPGTALDESNMEGFVRILDMVKCYFKTVLLISHLDSLKDIVDMQISIEKSGEYAHVQHTL